MSLDAVLLAAGLVVVLAAIGWLGIALKGELRTLRSKLDRLETEDATAETNATKINPRLAAARESAAARSAKRPGRTTVKRI